MAAVSLLIVLFACGGKRSAHFERGISAYDAGNFPTAVREFELAVREGDRAAEAQFNLGLSLLKAGRYSAAVQAYETYIANFGAAADVRINLGAAYAALGRHDKARAAYRQAVKLDETYAYPYVAFARYLLDHGGSEDWPEAHALMMEAVSLEPQSSNAHYLLGLVSEAMGRGDAACDAFAEAATLDSDNAEALLEAGYCALEAERYDAALQQFIVAGIGLPDEPRAFWGAAVCYRQRGDYERALQAFRRAELLGYDATTVHREKALTSIEMLNAQIERLLQAGQELGSEERALIEAKLENLRRLRDQWHEEIGR